MLKTCEYVTSRPLRVPPGMTYESGTAPWILSIVVSLMLVEIPYSASGRLSLSRSRTIAVEVARRAYSARTVAGGGSGTYVSSDSASAGLTCFMSRCVMTVTSSISFGPAKLILGPATPSRLPMPRMSSLAPPSVTSSLGEFSAVFSRSADVQATTVSASGRRQFIPHGTCRVASIARKKEGVHEPARLDPHLSWGIREPGGSPTSRATGRLVEQRGR